MRDKRTVPLSHQTLYSGKNKGNLSIAAGEQAPANTPEANAGTVSNDIILKDESSVNTNLSNESENYSEEGQFSSGSPRETQGRFSCPPVSMIL